MAAESTVDVMIDVDDVLFPMITSVHAVALELGLHDGSRPLEQWRGWEQYGCTEAEFWAAWNQFRDAGGYADTEPIEGVVAALGALRRAGHRAHLVTARGCAEVAVPGVDNEFVRAVTREWLQQFAVPYDTLTFARDKPAVQQQLGVRFAHAFDDHPGNVQKLLDAGVDAYLVNQPHNLIDPAAVGMPRVESLAAGLRELELIPRSYLCDYEGEHPDFTFVMQGGDPSPVALICSACGTYYDRRS